MNTDSIQEMTVLKDIVISEKYSKFKFVVSISDNFYGSRKGQFFSFGNMKADSMDQVNIDVTSDFVVLHRIGDGAKNHKYDFRPRELEYDLEKKIICAFNAWEVYYDGYF